MKVLYDPVYKACAVEFDDDDTIFLNLRDGKIRINSCKGGKPKIVKTQLLFSFEDRDARGKK